MSNEPVQRKLAAILAADVAGYSRLMNADETGTLSAMRDIWNAQFNPVVATHRGRIVKMMGDGALVEFASAVDAVECAVAIQEAMADYNASRGEGEPIEFRVGVNLGDIIIDGEDILGDGVNVAARLEGQAPEGGILVSDAIHAQIRGKTRIAFSDAGELRLKNIELPVRAWRWSSNEGPDTRQEKSAFAPSEMPSIAVLPFNNMSGDPDQEYFADGLVEDIITTLSKLASLRVIARNSSFVYKGQAVDVREAAGKLGVRYILEGSVRKGGNRIRITAQLIDASTGSHVWAERYDRSLDDIFAVQDEITLTLATEMQVKLTDGEQARLRYTTTSNVEAWNHYAEGMSYYRRPVTRESMNAARVCFEKALELDPDSAALNAAIGFMHYADARFGWGEDRDAALENAWKYIMRARELDPRNADSYTASGLVLMVEGRFEEATADARKAVQLAPGSAEVATMASFVLASSGEPAEALIQIEKAMTLSPHYPPQYLGHLGNARRLSGRFDEAIAAFKAYHARSPGFGLSDLVLAYQQTGRPEEAKQTAEQLLSIRRDFTVSSWAKTQFRADKERLAADIEALRAAGLPME